jgi:hypothetical protein
MDFLNFDPVQNHWWIVLASLVLLFGLRALIVAGWGNQVRDDTVWFLLCNLLWVPYVVYLTLWCYAHPERIANDPDGWTYDFRPYWPFFALIYFGFALWYGRRFMRRRLWWHWNNKGLKLAEHAKRLEAEGRITEAEIAYTEWQWIFDHKVKHLP